MSEQVWRTALRAAAVLVAIAAMIDPQVSRTRPSPMVISVQTARGDSALAREIFRYLPDDALLVHGPFPAAAVQVIGASTTIDAVPGGVRTIAIQRDAASPQILQVDAPREADRSAMIPVHVLVSGGRTGDSLVIALSRGSTLLATQRVGSGRNVVPLTFAAGDTGALRLTVTANVAAPEASNPPTGSYRGRIDSADFAVHVRDKRWRVLVYDARASWMSTFVRRTIEGDERYIVSSRTITSRDISTAAGAAPAVLDAASLAPFDVVVIGAPTALDARAVRELGAFVRDQGGAVLLLYDEVQPTAFDAMLQVGEWRFRERDDPRVFIARNDLGVPGRQDTVLRAAEWMEPRRVAGVPLVSAADTDGSSAMFDIAYGRGRFVVSGVLDAWRYREQSQSAWNDLWPRVVADLAAGRVRELSISPRSIVASAGATVPLVVRLDDARPIGSDGSIEVVATVAGVPGSAPDAVMPNVRRSFPLLPTGQAGVFIAPVEMPEDDATVQIVAARVVREQTTAADTTVAVSRNRVRGDIIGEDGVDASIAAAFARSTGGRAVPEAELASLTDIIGAVPRPAGVRQPWHPMRSPLWLLVFGTVLGAEWWLRRRSGRP